MEIVQRREQEVSKSDLGLRMEEHTCWGFKLACLDGSSPLSKSLELDLGEWFEFSVGYSEFQRQYCEEIDKIQGVRKSE